MKSFFFLIIVLLSQFAFADSFIIKNDGSKAIIKSNSFRVDASEKRIYYQLENNDSEIKMSFKDFDYVIFGVNKFKTFKLPHSNQIQGFFVLAEIGNKSLISITIPNQEEGSSKISYLFHVIDNQNTILETHEFNNIKNQKNAALRSEIYSKIKFYFSSCELLLNRLNYFDRNSQGIDNTSILSFFNTPVYLSCS